VTIVQAEKSSMQSATPMAEAIMWVGGDDILRRRSYVERILRLERGHPREQAVPALCGVLGGRKLKDAMSKKIQ
jgi:hypothetical protein